MDIITDHSLTAPTTADYPALRQIERKLLWLSSWMIHNANHLRPNRDGLKVGGHQASCASVVSIMTALYFHMLRPQDRVAVKPHAAPVLHAINYLLGRQTIGKMAAIRQMGGAQAYPSRAKDGAEIDFSTGSVGLGVAITSFAALIQDYLRAHDLIDPARPTARHVAIAGDAELDEGNIYEALLEGWKHDVRDVWWVVDYNRQSLDSVMPDRLFGRFEGLFRDMGWKVMSLKYGKSLESAFRKPGGNALRAWIDDCPNSLYSALTFQGGAAWRQALIADLGRARTTRAIIDPLSDQDLARLMTNLAGHDLPTLIEAFTAAAASDQPTCFLAYTTKGAGLPFAGHKDNHSGLMNDEQMAAFRTSMAIRDGHEWDKFEGLDQPDRLHHFIQSVPFATKLLAEGRNYPSPIVPVPAQLPHAPFAGRKTSTQGGFGEILAEIGRAEGPCAELARHIVTMSPDVTVSTNLGPWVNRRGVFDRHTRNDVFRDSKLASAQRWGMSPDGQHIELGIAEQNLFLLLAAAGLAAPMQGARLLPIGTVYDPFVNRGHDALVYGCYQDARFLLVATPSGITLAPEGGQHQSTNTPLLGMVQDRIAAYEPAYCDELALLLRHAFDWMQRPEGSSVWLRLSTRTLTQPTRTLDAQAVIAGAHWVHPPAPGARIAILYQGAVAPEAEAAFEALLADEPGAGLMALTSPDILFADWRTAQHARQTGAPTAQSPIETLLAPLAPHAALVTVLDGHPTTHAWLGGVRGQRAFTLGPDRFGQSGDIPDLYHEYRIDTDAILNACAQALL
ncbi:MAG TPA: 1-deoxy-D-xylulose-5-phosphate synthase N-terminal domain-containing protein [Acidiphilium sp.]|nr:MAG: transketolase [Acidiphilium sp. 21-60-14]OYV90740.1 MAG: transketolase [Acidiphilium sp. 37-60-79]OZB40040.1 MAG: transketolase [Acidiphilium sp. 34-60-192]HQT89576.1 1-deoxy-D-xylulose-5-phosphate synthase N-terminal domain-containing protein [Acidiphilium sp.]HQU24867.1 1-deoxy-D-xylulose-5-phosphate synthase N-terminal domain-containing protein [Acidiphilium sp.]